MNNRAMPEAISPAATCPDWCTSDHDREDRVPNEHGFWNLLHTSEPAYVPVPDVIPSGVAVIVEVGTEEYVSETPAHRVPRTVCVTATSEFGRQEYFALTARQALGLAELLVQQAAVVLADENAASAVAR